MSGVGWTEAERVREEAKALVLAEYGPCVLEDAHLCTGGHNDGYWEEGDEHCDQFWSWVSGAMLALAERDQLREQVTAERLEKIGLGNRLARVEALLEGDRSHVATAHIRAALGGRDA